MRCPCPWWLASCCVVLLVAGCAGSTQGPGTWIDRPLDGDRVPAGPLTILAHASAEDGVAALQFLVAGTPLATVSAGGRQLAEASTSWVPPAPGEYTIDVQAVDGRGNAGPIARVAIVVGAVPPLVSSPTPAALTSPLPLVEPTRSPTPAVAVQPSPTSRPLPVVRPTLSPALTLPVAPTLSATAPSSTPSPTTAPSPTTTPASDVRMWADDSALAAGACTTVRWRAAHVSAYWVDGNAGAGDTGSLQTCPCSDETHTLHVRLPDGTELDRSVTLRVRGECGEPAAGHADGGDTLGPAIGPVRLEPYGTADSGCRTVIHVAVTDPSGVSWVRLHYRLNGEEGNTIDLGQLGESDYGGPIPGSSGGAGSIEFTVEAADTLGNTTRTGSVQQSLPFCGPG